jgi:hypothetical protein
VTPAGPSAHSGNTAIDSVFENVGGGTPDMEHGTFVSTSSVTAGTAFTAGAGGSAGGSVAAIEVQPVGAAPVSDASSPAVVRNTTGTTATTAAFTPPPGGALILALASTGATGSSATITVTDSYGLTWTQATSNTDSAGGSCAAIWYAYTPAALVASGAPPGTQVSTAYSYALSATGGYGTYSWSLASGSLPTGLSLSSGGVISGTPTATGVYVFTATVTDTVGAAATVPLVIVVNKGIPAGGSILQGWTASAPEYFYGTLEIPIANREHDWLFVSVSWTAAEDAGIAYCADSSHNLYQQAAFSGAGSGVTTQVFAVPDARAASTVYVSTSAFVRNLTVLILDVTGLQPGYTVDASQVYSGGPATSFTESLSTAHPDFILAVGAFAEISGAITPSGSGATWTTVWGGINGSANGGLTQAASWAVTGGAASPSMQYTAASSNYSGCMIAVYSAGGLPANSNPAWPVTSLQAAFGYIPSQPTAPPAWTDITSRYLGVDGQRGRSFELDEIAAADLNAVFDNFDGALSPGGSYGADLITPIRLIKTWQGRPYVVFRGLMTALPETWEFQRGLIKAAVSDDFSKLPQALLPTCLIQAMLYDQPVSLWPLNEQQGALAAGNWSGRSNNTLVPTAVTGGAGTAPATQQIVSLFGRAYPFWTTPVPSSTKTKSAAPASPANAPATGFGNSNSGTWPAGLAGTTDSFWGCLPAVTSSSVYTGTVLVDANDSTLPLTSTGATYAVWAQMDTSNYPNAANATIMTLTDASGTAGTHVYLALYYNGTQVTVTQTAGSTSFTPAAPLFDGRFHLWAVTISTGGTITVYLDGVSLGSLAGTFPGGTPSMLQLGGDTTATTASTAGIFTGLLSTACAVDRVVDAERIQDWALSGITGYLDELAGTRIQRVLTWARWSAPQAVDPGTSLQQQFNYLTGGYGSNGISGAIGNFATAGGAALDSGAQSDATIQDIANSENMLLIMTADGTLAGRQHSNISSFPVGLAMGDQDYPLNPTVTFHGSLGEWVNTTSCTVALSAGWSYAGGSSALMTVTGTPASASVKGSQFAAVPGESAGFSGWVMSPQGCFAFLSVNWIGASSSSTGTTTWCPPMTPVFLSLAPAAAPALTTAAQGQVTITSSPATGTQLYFDRVRLSPAGFQCPYGDAEQDDTQVTTDIQYLYNDIALTRNVDQATYRARDATSRNKYFPRVYTRTVYTSVDDTATIPAVATTLLNAFKTPQQRVAVVTVDPAANPEAWPFALSADIGDLVSFSRNPVYGGSAVSGSFTILSVSPDLAPDKARFTYVLAPTGVF